MSDHNGVRMACPSCTWSCVMHAENEMPEGVNKLVEGVPWCPNCHQPMEPSGSVEPKTNGVALPATVMAAAVGNDVPIEKRLEVIRIAQTEVDQAKDKWDSAKERASDLRKEYDGKVLNLGSIIRRMTQVVEPAPLPLFDGTVERVAEGTGEPMTAVKGHTLMETAALTEYEGLRVRLEERGFTVTVAQLDAMSFDAYRELTAFVDARENGGTVAVPECLMAPADEPHGHDDAPAEAPPSRRRRKGQDEAQA